jgi:hypothetical protein
MICCVAGCTRPVFHINMVHSYNTRTSIFSCNTLSFNNETSTQVQLYCMVPGIFIPWHLTVQQLSLPWILQPDRISQVLTRACTGFSCMIWNIKINLEFLAFRLCSTDVAKFTLCLMKNLSCRTDGHMTEMYVTSFRTTAVLTSCNNE